MTQAHGRHHTAAATVHDSLSHEALQSLLTTAVFGRPLYVLQRTPSTNDEAKRLAVAGAAEGTAVLADLQTHGRGRQGRMFASPAGVGIYLSIILRPCIALDRLPQLTLLAGVAAADTLTTCSALPIRLKWPNDVEIHGKKVAGILTEAVLRPGAGPMVVLGIGINVNTRLEQLPEALHARVTSLALAAGQPFARVPIVAAFLAQLETLYGAFQRCGMAAIRQRWLAASDVIGRRVDFAEATTLCQGTVTDLADDGALLVREASGRLRRIIAGEITFV